MGKVVVVVVVVVDVVVCCTEVHWCLALLLA